MQQPIVHTILNNHFWLTTLRCIFWQQENALILSDLHLGKTGHFRKNAIAVPQTIYKADLHRLFEAITFFNPKQLLVVGDLFHSTNNLELNLFTKWRANFPTLHIHLIKGNHDILPNNWYAQNNITIHTKHLTIGQFNFVHDALDNQQPNLYTFTGHVHPSVKISGLGKQSLHFPCYLFAQNYAILPAFSLFTGMVSVKQKKAHNVFAITPNSVIKV